MMSTACSSIPILFVLLVMSNMFGPLKSAPTLRKEEMERSSNTKTVSILTKLGLTETVVNNLVMVNSTKLSYGVGVIIGTIFLTAALYENGLLVFNDKTALVDATVPVAGDRKMGRQTLAATFLSADSRNGQDQEFHELVAPQLHSLTDSFTDSILEGTSFSHRAAKHYFKGRLNRRIR